MKLIISIFLGLSLLVALFFSIFGLTRVSGSAMEPNFPDGKNIISLKYLFSTPNPTRGQVVLYEKEDNIGNDFIGRVVGLSGESILVKNGEIFIERNSQKSKIEESYVFTGAKPQIFPEDEWIKLDDFSYLILPDKRDKGVDLNNSKVNRAKIKAAYLLIL